MQPEYKFVEDFSNAELLDIFVIPNQASKIIWDVNSNNIKQISSQIICLVKNNKINIQMIHYLIDKFSEMREKDIEIFAELYQGITNEIPYNIKPTNKRLADLLYYKGHRYSNDKDFSPKKTEEEALYIYSTESPLYCIAWDDINGLKSKFPDSSIEKLIWYKMHPIDYAIKYGSELCFNYLKNLGAKYHKKSAKYAIKGRNINIFMQMVDDGVSFDNLFDLALYYKNYEIAEYIQTHFKPNNVSLIRSLDFGNYDIASYLINKGVDVNEVYIHILILFIIIL
ncbi:hypothetical protein TVAG_266950 [Trichomonas vaginalis G3]|uniref:DUF3447 domain-containing protein n=1 Tax=Trichomonas vaginalis (strain ATCC PRA-98 / G3) TaxID=412133 RepID=A2DQP8_TRIV3|nr:protein ubiquitination [Trichomonas vaginalis G3]EAY17332.1 hypothetical protein TVAG_266950 [Trichomonas vaginalis G3]KAI5523177.1 protein ubiquitination [Trichomonas vaginalis G3]|eukprot:XP_001329555.1 hypothetical protein [Trichomonas vaginalis G3]